MYAFKWFIIIIPVMFMIAWSIVSRVSMAIVETVRIQSTAKSPLLSYLGETFNGLSTIRAF